MSHEITATDKMVYTKSGGVPWHGLGIPIGDDMTPEECLVTAGLDFKVKVQPMRAEGCPESTTEKVICRWDKGAKSGIIFGGCGSRYHPVQNDEAFEVFDKYVKAGDMHMETAGSLKGGRFVWGLAKTKQGFTLPGGDDVNGYLLLVNPHVMGWVMQAKFTPTRVVCWNTLSYALGSAGLTATYKHRHHSQFDEVAKDNMLTTLGMVTEAMQEYHGAAEVLTKKSFSEKDNVVYLSRVFEPTLADRLKEKKAKFPESFQAVQDVDQELLSGRSSLKRIIKMVQTDPDKNFPGYSLKSSKNTAWGAFNIVTRSYDHILGNSDETRMYNAIYGDVQTRKQRALETALEMAA